MKKLIFLLLTLFCVNYMPIQAQVVSHRHNSIDLFMGGTIFNNGDPNSGIYCGLNLGALYLDVSDNENGGIRQTLNYNSNSSYNSISIMNIGWNFDIIPEIWTITPFIGYGEGETLHYLILWENKQSYFNFGLVTQIFPLDKEHRFGFILGTGILEPIKIAFCVKLLTHDDLN